MSAGIVLDGTCISEVPADRQSRGHLVYVRVIRVIPQNAVAHAHNSPNITIIDSLLLQLLLMHIVVILMHSSTPDDPSFVE